MTSNTSLKKTTTTKKKEVAPKSDAITKQPKEDKTAELEKLIREQAAVIEQLKTQLQAKMETAGADNREKVTFLWQAPVADDNITEFGADGRFGRIIGKVGNIMIPKTELSQIMDSRVRYFMDHRWLIVLSGLDESEREMFGVKYKEGEYLSKEAFLTIPDMGNEILEIYPNLCEAHKEIVAKFMYEAWAEGKELERETITALNKISKSEAFQKIIEEMNERDASK